MSSERSVFKHQQQGVSLRAFSEQTGIKEAQLRYYIQKGRILGARKHPLTKKWIIYPPAKLLFPDSASYTPRSKAANPGSGGAVGALAPKSAAAVAVDFGTSPHGLNRFPTESSLQGGQPPAVQDLEACTPSLQAAFKACTGPEAARPDLPRPGHAERDGGGFIPRAQAAPRVQPLASAAPSGADGSPGELPNLLAEPEDQDELDSDLSGFLLADAWRRVEP